MSQEGYNKAKKEEDDDENYLRSCEKCTKFFTNQQVYERHLKMKHCQEQLRNQQSPEEEEEHSQEEQEEDSPNNNKKNSKSMPIRTRMLEIQRNELQDNIYTFLGELGEKNVEPISSRAEIINFASDQKLTGQTNYCMNKVIRTPYEQPIKCSQEILQEDFNNTKHPQFLKKLKEELTILQAQIEVERQKWELRDPMAPEEEVVDQFSLMEVAKLIRNYHKRELNMKYPHFSIFLLWAGRICKAPAFREFFFILGEYIAEYYASEASKAKGDQAYQQWRDFYKAFEKKKIEAEEIRHLRIFQEKNCRKFIDYFVQWTDLFKALHM